MLSNHSLTCSGVGVVVPCFLNGIEYLGDHVLHPRWHATVVCMRVNSNKYRVQKVQFEVPMNTSSAT